MKRMIWACLALFVVSGFAGADENEDAVIDALKRVGGVYATRGNVGKEDQRIIGIDLRITGERKADEIAAAVKELAKLPHLQSLLLVGISITNETAREVAQLKELQSLQLFNTRVSDEGIKELLPLQKLRRLIFSGTGISDKAMTDIARLKGLQYLEIIDAPISDAGLMELAELQQLRRLVLANGGVTPQGIERLRERLPDLQFGERFMR